MATVNSDADEIRLRMAEIRSRLRQDVRGVARDAADAADWTAHVRHRPWTAIGVAFAAGFLVVPSRRPRSTVIVEPSSQPREIVVTPPSEKRSGFRPIRLLLAAAGPVALRAAQSYALNFVENHLANNSRPDPRRAGAPTSVEPRSDSRRATRS